MTGRFADHSLLVFLAIAAVFTFVWLWQFRRRLSIKIWALVVISILHIGYGVLCVKVFAVLETMDLNSVENMSLFGAVFFMPVAYFVGSKITKRKPADVFDIFTVCLVFTLFCARINCLITGCCLGCLIPGAEPARWPTREAELVYYIVFLALVIPKVLKKDTKGFVYPIYMVSYGIFRAVIECFRESSAAGIFHVSHVWAILAIIIGGSVYFELKRRTKRKVR